MTHAADPTPRPAAPGANDEPHPGEPAHAALPPDAQPLAPALVFPSQPHPALAPTQPQPPPVPPAPAAREDTLPTACPSLDRLLDGGLEDDAITLVFGEGGSGKTNLALQCAREATRRGGRVAYVDTEGVSSVRLQQIFAACPGLRDQVFFFTPFSIDEQERMVQNATRLPGLGLVVVDSINMHYRLHLDGTDDAVKDATRSLYKQLHLLTNFARQSRVPVLVTGQVYGGEDTTQPFARRVMEHLVKALLRFEKRPDGSRRATVVKHRSIPDGRMALFSITAEGLEAARPQH